MSAIGIKHRTLISTLLCLFWGECIVGLCGCTTPRYDEIGSAQVAVLSISPWRQVASELQPKFELKPEKALQKINRITQTSNQRITDAFRMYIKAGLDGQTKIGGDSNLPKINDSQLQMKFDPNLSSGTNAMLEYWAATALYQEVKLINRYIKDAAIACGYTPYMVRLQISVMPNKRNEPYDVYSMLSFFSNRYKKEPNIGEKNKTNGTKNDKSQPPFFFKLETFEPRYSRSDAANEPNAANKSKNANEPNEEYITPIVIPLLVTDSIEQAHRAGNIDTLRQLALGVQLAFTNISGQASGDALFRNELALVGQEENSLMSVARVSENTIRVRLGAKYQVALPNQNLPYAMVTRTHYVSVLVLVPQIKYEYKTERQLALLWNNKFSNAKTGKSTESMTQMAFAMEVGKTIIRWTWDDLDLLTFFDIFFNSDKWRYLKMLSIYAITDDFTGFKNILDQYYNEHTKEDPNENKYTWDARCAAIWSDVASLRTRFNYGIMRVELPKDSCPELPPQQKVFVYDDGKTITAKLAGVRYLDEDKLIAYLCESSVPEASIYAHTIKVDRSNVALGFPSIKRIKIKINNSGEIKDWYLHLKLKDDGCAGSGTPEEKYSSLNYVDISEKPPISENAYNINTGGVTQLNSVNKKVTLSIGFERTKNFDSNDAYFFKIEPVNAKLTDANGIQTLKPVPNSVSKWQIINEGNVEIMMTNFAEKITLKAWSMKEGKITQAPFFEKTLPIAISNKEE